MPSITQHCSQYHHCLAHRRKHGQDTSSCSLLPTTVDLHAQSYCTRSRPHTSDDDDAYDDDDDDDDDDADADDAADDNDDFDSDLLPVAP